MRHNSLVRKVIRRLCVGYELLGRSPLGVFLCVLMLFPTSAMTAEVAPAPVAASPAYRLGAGDKLRITVFGEPALTGEYAVTAEGNLSFPLVGEIVADGRTIANVRETLRDRLNDGYIEDARVAVEPISYRPYYVLGEVNRPGEYPYSAGLRIEQAIAAAGGFTYRANRGAAYVRNSSGDDEKKIKLRKQPVRVLPGDTIRIGERYL